jgi:DNA-directed RNA polymerase specialized sigma24 family protein
MLGSRSDPCCSASWALSVPPPQAYTSPRRDRPWTDQRGSHQCSAHHRSRTAWDGSQPAQQPSAVRLTLGSFPGTDDQLRTSIADAMRQLPFEHRAVIYRAYYQGWTTSRIADDLKIPDAAVKSRLHDGLRALRLGVLG